MNYTKCILTLDEEETDIVTKALEHLAVFNIDIGRSNSEVYNLMQRVNPKALNNFLKNKNTEG